MQKEIFSITLRVFYHNISKPGQITVTRSERVDEATLEYYARGFSVRHETPLVFKWYIGIREYHDIVGMSEESMRIFVNGMLMDDIYELTVIVEGTG